MSTENSIQEPPAYPGDWKGGVDEYLREHDIIATKVTPLEGGTSCYLWRLDGLKDAECSPQSTPLSKPAVLKCADSVAKGGPVAVDPNRLQTEVKALRSTAVAEACSQEPSVQVVSVLRETHNGIIMSWAGDTDLRNLYKTDTSTDFSIIGERLGKWLAFLHLAGIASGPGELDSRHETLEKLFSGPGGMEEQAIKSALCAEDDIERVLKLSRTPSLVQTVTPWDFRPSNIVLSVPREEEALPVMTVVDWELCHYGDPINDLRMWVAEVIIMEAQHGNRGLVSSFLAAYKTHAGSSIIDRNFIRKVAVAVGVFLLYFIGQGAELWGFTEKDSQEWTGKAIEYLKAGADDNVAWLSQSPLKPLMD
ncbi:hypothetical protein CI238_08319 [Colletotrichum incanum]|uniref:Aminoglycoside phosphotransferase domain-containing protein n=1 Tax=Colletotrichum incanum TaxID=1573173 RepID=A0A167AXT6_COLIC|nr:hypothetical protein CI238_08319 [Colletotrichum incanum]OHW99118.1 hypothetical protein CSPAE12_02125 [Colletotrichum incanum]